MIPRKEADIAIWSWQTPDIDPLPDLLELLNGAQRSIRISAYGFTLPEVVDAIIAAHGRGVDVRIIFDSSQARGKAEVPQVERLRAAGIPFVIGRSARGGIVHLKLAVIDESLVWTGSWNWSASASEQDNEAYMFRWREEAASRIEKFDRNWRRLGGKP